MTPADWDREPTSDAERARWRVDAGSCVVWDDQGCIGTFATPELAAEAVHAHNVLHAAREQRALGVGLHDGCVPRGRLVQAGWYDDDRRDDESGGLHRHDGGRGHEGGEECWPVFVLLPQVLPTTEGATEGA